MKEIQEILKKIESLQPNEKAILATVVDVQGSSYRLPGAKMLVLENGDTFGTVSGGCLEADVLERATKVIESGTPQIFTYDTTKNEDSVFSFNMGCRGVIRILLEPIRNNPFIEFLRCCFEKEQGVAATSIGTGKDGIIGDRIFFVGDGKEQNEFASKQIREKAVEVLASGISQIEKYEFGDVFFDYLSLPINLTIFGAGADAVPLCVIAKGLGWHVTIVEHREAFANKERFPNTDDIIVSHPEQTADNVRFNQNSIAVLMTHNYEHDKNILRYILKSKAKYIGALGPKRRSENILREFAEEGLEFTEKELKKLYSPVGLDIGADTPEAIALAILAEIQAVLKSRDGGFLRNRKGSIYGRNVKV